VIENEGNGIMYCFSVDEMVVVEDNDKAGGSGSDIVDQRGQDRRRRRWLWRLKGLQGVSASPCSDGLNCGDKIAKKRAGIVVTSIQ
jgi:hypothetical protein